MNLDLFRKSDDDQWLPISDLMSGLMVLFLFIAISLMLQVRQVAESHQENQDKIYHALIQEFEKDLPTWGAQVDKKTLTLSFKSPELLFETGSSKLRPNYQAILSDFFPRYMRVISEHKEHIQEIRIEGHTSSEWANGVDEHTAYFENMRLSQERTRAVLHYVYHIDSVRHYQAWIKENLASVGLSSAKTIKDEFNQENKEASKRVTFRIISNSDEQLNKIIEN